MLRSFSSLFCWLAAAFMPFVASAALQNGKVEVGVVKGTASLIDPQAKTTALSKGIVFQEGYKVETSAESTAELILSNGSTLIVNPDTSLEVRTFKQVPSELIIEGQYQKLDKEPSPSVTEILVHHGKVIGEVRKLNPQSSYTIKTPAGVARIRGTIYTVEYVVDKNGVGSLSIGCVRGSVEATVANTTTGPIPVLPGKTVSVAGISGILTLAGSNVPSAPVNNTPTPVPGVPLPNLPVIPGGGTTTVANNSTPPPMTVALVDMDSTQLSQVATTLASSTSLPPSISNDVKDMAKVAPQVGQTTPTTIGGSVPNQGPAGGAPVTPPSAAPNTSNGGSSSTTSQLMQQISDVVNNAVQKQQQPDPSPSGG
jgi:hypothetical protein